MFIGLTAFTVGIVVAIVTPISHRSKLRFSEVREFVQLVTGRTGTETDNY